MSPEDRESITTSVANLWSLHAIILAEIMRALRDTGALSPERSKELLERIDGLAFALQGESDQAYTTNLVATVRHMLEAE